MTIILCGALSAVLFYLSQGLNDVWALAWLAPVPLLWLAYGSEPRWRVWAASFVAFTAGQIYFLQCYAAYIPPAVLVAIMAILSIAFATTVWFSGFLYRRRGAALATLAFPCSWTSFEYLFAQVSPHGTFGSIAYSQVSMPLVIQTASLFGLYAITFLLCLAANAIALLLREGIRALLPAGAALAVCALGLIWGAARLAAPQSDVIRVAALSDIKTDAAANHARTQTASIAAASTYAEAVRDVARRGARFVVTPEGGIPIHGSWRSAAYAPLADAARQTGAQIVAGIYDASPAEDIAVSFRPDGHTFTYAKRHTLMPLEAEFTRGHSPGLLGQGRAVAICKDMDFPKTLRGDAASGDIRIMAVPAGDFVTDGWIHARMAIMRGVENGFAIVRAANDGLLTVSDAEGRVIARKTADPRAGMSAIIADVPLGSGATLYTRSGDLLPWASLALTLLLGALSLKPRRASPSAQRPAVSVTS